MAKKENKNRIYYFKTIENMDQFIKFNENKTLSDKEYNDLVEKAKTVLQEKENLKEKWFNENAFFISSNSLHGFYFNNEKASIYNNNKYIRVVAFKNDYTFDFEKHEKIDLGIKAYIIYSDENENLLLCNYYDLDREYLEKKKQEYNGYIEKYKKDINFLESIKIVLTKSGDHFKILSKAFTSDIDGFQCKIYQEYSWQDSKKIEFYARGYNSYNFDIYTKDSDGRELAFVRYGENYYLKNDSDIMQDIKQAIEARKKWIKQEENRLKVIDKNFNDIVVPLIQKMQDLQYWNVINDIKDLIDKYNIYVKSDMNY